METPAVYGQCPHCLGVFVAGHRCPRLIKAQQSNNSGKMVSVLLDFIHRVKGGEKGVIIHGPDYVVMDRATYDDLREASRNKA